MSRRFENDINWYLYSENFQKQFLTQFPIDSQNDCFHILNYLIKKIGNKRKRVSKEKDICVFRNTLIKSALKSRYLNFKQDTNNQFFSRKLTLLEKELKLFTHKSGGPRYGTMIKFDFEKIKSILNEKNSYAQKIIKECDMFLLDLEDKKVHNINKDASEIVAYILSKYDCFNTTINAKNLTYKKCCDYVTALYNGTFTNNRFFQFAVSENYAKNWKETIDGVKDDWEKVKNLLDETVKNYSENSKYAEKKTSFEYFIFRTPYQKDGNLQKFECPFLMWLPGFYSVVERKLNKNKTSFLNKFKSVYDSLDCRVIYYKKKNYKKYSVRIPTSDFLIGEYEKISKWYAENTEEPATNSMRKNILKFSLYFGLYRNFVHKCRQYGDENKWKESYYDLLNYSDECKETESVLFDSFLNYMTEIDFDIHNSTFNAKDLDIERAYSGEGRLSIFFSGMKIHKLPKEIMDLYFHVCRMIDGDDEEWKNKKIPLPGYSLHDMKELRNGTYKFEDDDENDDYLNGISEEQKNDLKNLSDDEYVEKYYTDEEKEIYYKEKKKKEEAKDTSLDFDTNEPLFDPKELQKIKEKMKQEKTDKSIITFDDMEEVKINPDSLNKAMGVGKFRKNNDDEIYDSNERAKINNRRLYEEDE